MAGSGRPRRPLVAEKRYSPAKASTDKPKAKPAKPPKRKAPRKRGLIGTLVYGLLGFVLRLFWGIGWRVGLVVAGIVGLATFYFYSQLPEVSALLDGRHRGSVTMLDREGKVFAWRGETFGGQTTATNVSPHLKNAVVATEDKRFYGHFGVSPRGIASAVRINLSEGRGPFSGNGGSTITQQVAKLLCLGVKYDPAIWKTEAAYENDCRSGGLKRKIKEIPFALAMEVKYTKDEILTIYLNRAYLGAGARGFEAAAQRYFGISSANLNPQQAAMLAGLLKAPTRYAPTNNLKRSQDRAETVLALMHDQEFLTDAEWREAVANPATLSEAAQKRAGGYFADWIMDAAPDFLTTQTTEDVIIDTTLDQRIQTAAEDAMKYIFETKVKEGSEAEAAIVVMSADGAVRAMVGGRATQVTGAFNHATMAKRQTGSTFKPFVYAAALDMGHTPDDIVEDAPLTINVPGSGNWSPKNYTREYRGPITLTDALTHSVNTATVRVSEAVGRDAVRQVARDFGFASDLADGPAVALGVSESTLLEMTGAYAGILNGGSAVKPHGLSALRLKGDSAPLFTETQGIGERVISEKAARELIYMMRSVVQNGSGRRANLPDREAAGKTGTTQASRDAWFIGFTADYVTGIWMGYDDNRPLSGVTGGGLPADIWRETMVRVEEGLPASPLPMADPSEWRYAAQPWAQEGVTLGPGNRKDDWSQPMDARRPVEKSPDVAESILLEVLRAITGGN
ncbi:transglycosylase domain-containing protein [Thioclava sp. A2]|uniref:transglycosylase domain-containing protein n=1 Tax=Thioclava sp. FCG-A2 TaxID=3080562 RepID=UPI0029541629|nr:transglycosylase domain-containing protein [Thioclava sp. A2]MDV7270983.1 transglycosylase domain-containing protein [Thioclava sp. A2]